MPKTNSKNPYRFFCCAKTSSRQLSLYIECGKWQLHLASFVAVILISHNPNLPELYLSNGRPLAPKSLSFPVRRNQLRSRRSCYSLLARECGINEDCFKHPLSLSYRLPWTIFTGLCICLAIVPKPQFFRLRLRKSIAISTRPPGAYQRL